MADFLIYWKDFWEDKKDGNSNFDERWHTGLKWFYNNVEKGDNLWFITFDNKPNSDEWRLVSRIVVEKKEPKKNRKKKPYGISGNNHKSKKFDIESQSDFTPIIHKLEFKSGKKITARGRTIGLFLRQIRPLSATDNTLLEDYSKNLKLRNNKVEQSLTV